MADEHPQNKANHLIDHRWQPGESGNPRGRPKGRGVVDFLHKYGRMKAARVPAVLDKAVSLGLDPQRVTVAQVTALRLWVDAATAGGTGAVRTLLDRLHGIPVASDVLATLDQVESLIERAEHGDS